MKSKFKGWIGEIAVNICGKIGLSNKKYYKFHDVILPSDYGTSQIDHIVVSKNGIFVIETKMMLGWIYGKQYDKFWTQKFPNKSFKFQNPLRQNYGHIKALQAFLPELPDDAFKSVISMCGEHKIKTEMPENVTRGAWYVGYIRSFKESILTDDQVQMVVEVIKKNKLPNTKETKKKHIENILERKH